MSAIDPDPEATTIDRLFELHDVAFVEAAYRMILERPADNDGLAFYLRRLRSGVAPEQIVVELADSGEGTARSALRSEAVAELRRRLPKPHTGLWDRLMRRVMRPSLDPLFVQGRRTENAVFRVITVQTATFERIEAQIDALRATRHVDAVASSQGVNTAQEIWRMKRFIDAPGR